jgi:hypothetical protein
MGKLKKKVTSHLCIRDMLVGSIPAYILEIPLYAHVSRSPGRRLQVRR